MREIKFRAWDKKNDRYFKECNYLSFTPTGIRFIWHNPEQDELMVTTLLTMDCELMQFTGLKDKNGKEIYEGDIVRLHFTSDKDYKVLWRKELMWSLQPIEGKQWKPLGVHREECYEVIGNIYENKELLKEE